LDSKWKRKGLYDEYSIFLSFENEFDWLNRLKYSCLFYFFLIQINLGEFFSSFIQRKGICEKENYDLAKPVFSKCNEIRLLYS
jgi:hypothetical protein